MAIPIIFVALFVYSQQFQIVPNSKTEKLIFAQVLFRHGARAPSAALTNDSYYSEFPRGLGELTDRGFENSYKLGKFLRNRYVKSGFLDKNLKSKEMYWRSVKLPRCLSTAATVGAAMFEDESRHLNVPVFTEELYETLLNYNMAKCYREHEIIRNKCKGYESPSQFPTWPQFEEFIANCWNYTHQVFEKYPFHMIEAYINEYKNGLPLPELIRNNLKDVLSIYSRVIQAITGTGINRNRELMNIKFGQLFTTLIRNMRESWNCHRNKECALMMKKFKVFSTQDWVLIGILDSFGVLNATIGFDDYPEYNSMIILELWDSNDAPKIKFYYKKEEETLEDHPLLDVTSNITFCQNMSDICTLENLENGLDGELGLSIEEKCAPLRKESIMEEESKKIRFVGPG